MSHELEVATKKVTCQSLITGWKESLTLQPIWHTIRAVGPDLMSFSIIEKLLVFSFATLSIIFSILDFNALIYPEAGYISVIKFINDEYLYGTEYWRRVIMCMSGVCSFTGVLGVVLTTKRKRSNYFWGLINSVVYGIYAFAYGYAGDAQLFIIYFVPMQFVGMYKWDKEINQSDQNVNVNPLKWYWGLFYFVLLWLIAVGFYFEIPAFARALNGYYIFDPEVIGTQAPLILDACSNAFNVIAQQLNVNRHWQQWPAWLAVNCIQIAMWSGVSTFPADFNILVMWSLFLVNSLCGLYVWVNNQRRPLPPAATVTAGQKEPAKDDDKIVQAGYVEGDA